MCFGRRERSGSVSFLGAVVLSEGGDGAVSLSERLLRSMGLVLGGIMMVSGRLLKTSGSLASWSSALPSEVRWRAGERDSSREWS